jgi:hypothetical protein
MKMGRVGATGRVGHTGGQGSGVAAGGPPRPSPTTGAQTTQRCATRIPTGSPYVTARLITVVRTTAVFETRVPVIVIV